MCTKLKQNGEIIIPGMSATIKTGNNEVIMIWGFDSGYNMNANARIENLDYWKRVGYNKVGVIEVDSFFEKKTEFRFSKPGELGVIISETNFLLVTEPADGKVARVHHRQPCKRLINNLKLAV